MILFTVPINKNNKKVRPFGKEVEVGNWESKWKVEREDLMKERMKE